MPSSGKSALPQLSLDPFFLLDHNLSHLFAPALQATGFNVTSVMAEFKGSHWVADEEIIARLARLGRHRAVWVTADTNAQRAHGKLIIAEHISVLWVFEPGRRSLTGIRQLQLLSLVIFDVHRIVAETSNPVYLRASLNVWRPRLERLAGSLIDSRLDWRRLTITSQR